jgi:octanoyl-[GcvH]:protein N-octanoyltransferase
MTDTDDMPSAAGHEQQRSLVVGHPSGSARSPVADLVVPAALLRARHTPSAELVHVSVAAGPTVAFSSKDLRSPGIVRATRIARDAGFAAVVRSPGGRMVAYDSGAVVIDHLSRSTDLRQAGPSTFAHHAGAHADVLRTLGIDARVGEVEGEYCPGEYSVNVGGQAKIAGSAQRVTGTGALFSTVVQVAVADAVREVIVAISDALGYRLRETSITGLTDHAPRLTADLVADAFAADYRRRLTVTDAHHEPGLLEHAAPAADMAWDDRPFDVDAWCRANPYDAAQDADGPAARA